MNLLLAHLACAAIIIVAFMIEQPPRRDRRTQRRIVRRYPSLTPEQLN